MSDELQALCFLAGANSIFYGEKLLTTGNPDTERDMALFAPPGPQAHARSNRAAPCTPTSSKRLRTPRAAITVPRLRGLSHGASELA